jgi:hypothetical protein
MYDLTRLHTPLLGSEKVEWKRIQAELDGLLGQRSERELQVLEIRILIATRQSRELMALFDAISDALLEGDLPDEHPCWERSKYLTEKVALMVVKSFVALRPATRRQRLLANKLRVPLPARCSSIEAAHQIRRTLHLRRLGREND